jgi:AraC family transcriptional regulator
VIYSRVIDKNGTAVSVLNMIKFIEQHLDKNAMISAWGESMPKDKHMQKALSYIDKNITGEISLYDIAREAGFSVPHFYRLFKRLTGDSVGAYIVRRKISMAAHDLTVSDEPVTGIAFKYGFESHDVFTRAFKRVYGLSPISFRRCGGAPPLKRLPTAADMREGTGQMTFSLWQTDGFYVIGMECDAVIWDDDGSIGRLWSDFLTLSDAIKKPAKPLTMYGICEHETSRGDRFRYMAAIGVNPASEAPPGMTKRYVREQSFIMACVPDSVATPDAYAGTIGYAKSLGYETELYDNIEVYDEIFHDPDDHCFKLLIPVK